MPTNPGCNFDATWLHTCINEDSIINLAKEIPTKKQICQKKEAALLLKAVTLIDLTTLNGNDTETTVSNLCEQAAKGISPDVLERLDFDYQELSPIHTAAVCVYPVKVRCAVETLNEIGFAKEINVASVAAGFPSGQTPLETRIPEITYAVRQGAKEIDIVIDRSLVLDGKWSQLYDEIKQMKQACGTGVHFKVILSTGELETFTNVHKASMVAMMAGADFIKTSTGKEAVNATLPVGIVMAQAIKDYESKTGYKVGLKPAGGIRTCSDALEWMKLVDVYLGKDWLKRDMFRFGASGLLWNIEEHLEHYVT